MRHTPRIRDAARKLYIAGESVPSISERLGASQRAIYSWASRGGWSQERKEIGKLAAEKSRESLIDERARVDQTYFRLWDKLIAKAEKILHDVDAVADAKDRAATLCTLGLTLLRGQKGHYIAGGWTETAPPPAEDEIQNLSDEELKREIDRLDGELSEENAEREEEKAPQTQPRVAQA